MSKSFRKDLTGQRFGRLIVLRFVPTDGYNTYWECKCDCGNTKIVKHSNLTSGQVASCGCLKRSHTKSTTKLYKVWTSMRQRCLNPRCESYKNYGGRGIAICAAWDDFQKFYNWAISNGYKEGLSIDRIDNNGNYEPSNCQWADRKTQGRNRRTNIFINYKGKEMTLLEASNLSGIPFTTLCNRYHNGERGEKMFRPPQEHKKVK